MPPRRARRYYLNLALFTILIILFAYYLALPAALAAQDIHPRRHPIQGLTPADFGHPYETLTFPARDGLALAAWYIPSRNGAAIIVAHAYNGNRTGMLYHADFLADQGYGVLLFDLRAHGESQGEVFPLGLDTHLDVLGALDYLQRRAGIDPGRIGALGASAGAKAVLAAAAQDERLRAVVADGAGLRTMHDYTLVSDLPAWLNAPFTFVYMQTAMLITGVEEGASMEALISRIAPRPVFLIAAGKGQERRLNEIYYAAAGEPKTLWLLPKSSHIRGLFTDSKEYQSRVLRFFDEALSSR